MRILRLEEVIEITSLPGSSIEKHSETGGFPDPINLGDGHRGWIESEVNEWIKDRIFYRDKANGTPSAWGPLDI